MNKKLRGTSSILYFDDIGYFNDSEHKTLINLLSEKPENNEGINNLIKSAISRTRYQGKVSETGTLKDLSDFPIPTGPMGVIINMNLNEDSNLLFEPEKDKKQNVVIVNGSGELKNEGLW